MPKITLSDGESLSKLLSKSGNILDISSGIWLVESGSLQKRACISADYFTDEYTVINLYAAGDYFIGDSDLKVDYFALENTIISTVAISEIDPVKLLFQLDSLESLLFLNTYHLETPDNTKGKVHNFLVWASKKLNRNIADITRLLTQEEIGKLLNLSRLTVHRKLKMINFRSQ